MTKFFYKVFSQKHVLFLIICIGFTFRLLFIVNARFPLNDGGLFYTMTQEIIDNHFLLPKYTTYNYELIPFSYPPFTLYITAFLKEITTLPLIYFFQLIPLFISSITILAFYKLSKLFFQDNTTLLFAVLAFSLLPGSFEWEIMGGGLTRSFGFLFAILSLYYGYQSFNSKKKSLTIISGFLLGLTFVSHLGMSFFAVYSLLLFTLISQNIFHAIRTLFLMLLIALCVSSPWWITIITYHGIAPFLAAFTVKDRPGSDFLPLLFFNFTDEPLLPYLAVMGLCGFFFSLYKKRFFIPVWLLIIFLLTPGTARTFVTIPLALLIGIGLKTLLSIFQSQINQKNLPKKIIPRNQSNLIVTFFLFMFFYGIMSMIVLQINPWIPLHALSSEDIHSMEWVKNHTPRSAKFLLITSVTDSYWWQDKIMEWFPTIAERKSIATVQGSEWLLKNGFANHIAVYNALKSCIYADAACLESWSKKYHLTFDYIYIVTSKSNPYLSRNYNFLIFDLNHSKNYTPIYNDQGATIWMTHTLLKKK